jgi:hypothetical protein
VVFEQLQRVPNDDRGDEHALLPLGLDVGRERPVQTILPQGVPYGLDAMSSPSTGLNKPPSPARLHRRSVASRSLAETEGERRAERWQICEA